MARTNPISKVFDSDTYANQKVVSYFLQGGKSAVTADPDAVEIPISVAYRIYYLARAYDGQVVKQIKPRGSVRVDYFHLVHLIPELAVILETTVDPLVESYLQPLLNLLKQSSFRPGCELVMMAASDT